jgi:hypothetical protein
MTKPVKGHIPLLDCLHLEKWTQKLTQLLLKNREAFICIYTNFLQNSTPLSNFLIYKRETPESNFGGYPKGEYSLGEVLERKISPLLKNIYSFGGDQ